MPNRRQSEAIVGAGSATSHSRDGKPKFMWSAYPFRTNGHFMFDFCTCGHVMSYDHEACGNAFAENRGTSRCSGQFMPLAAATLKPK